jgi:multiple sugar transport system substrate-binding protein
MLHLVRRLFVMMGFVLALSGTAFAQTTIELWSNLSRGDKNVRTRTLDHVMTTFEAANPGIKVNVVHVKWSEISPMLLRAARANKTPDVSMMFSPLLPIPVAAKVLLPLDKYLAKWSKDKLDDIVIFPAAKDKAGKIYGLPLELRVTGIMHRKDILDKAGVATPRTLIELAETAKKLSGKGWVGIGIGFSPTKPDAGMDWFVPTLVGLGGKPLNKDGTANFKTPEMRKLVGWIHDLVHKYKVLPLDVALLGDNEVQTFAEAKMLVFLPKMTHRLKFIRNKSGLGEAYQMMNALTFDPNRPAPAFVQGWNLTIPRASKHPDIAWKLIEHWTSSEMQLYQGKTAGYIPVRKSVAGDPVFEKSAHIQWALKYAGQYPLDFAWPENYFVLYTNLAKLVSNVVSNRMSFDEAAAAAEQAYNNEIK